MIESPRSSVGSGQSEEGEFEVVAATTDASTKEIKLLPGDLAIWLFIFMELLVFGIFFIAFAVVRIKNTELFNACQLALNRELGMLNTLLLITSSYFVVLAVSAIRRGEITRCVSWIYASLACGFGFLVLKFLEYYDKFTAGISLSTNTFYMFYLSLTIFHVLHVVLGMLILFAIIIKAKRGAYSASNHAGVETGASYWHMVDLVWVVLFPLVYIIR